MKPSNVSVGVAKLRPASIKNSLEIQVVIDDAWDGAITDIGCLVRVQTYSASSIQNLSFATIRNVRQKGLPDLLTEKRQTLNPMKTFQADKEAGAARILAEAIRNQRL